VTPALLDVDVLAALFDPAHVLHEPAHQWFARRRTRGWATCSITQASLVRVLSNPRYGSNAERPSAVLARLRAFTSSADHHYWPADVSLLDEGRFDLSAATHRHVTAIYLAGLAHAHGGVLATFDRAIPSQAITDGAIEIVE